MSRIPGATLMKNTMKRENASARESMVRRKKVEPGKKERDEEEDKLGQQFYRIIHPVTVEDDTKLKIPPKFVRKFGKELSDVAYLMVMNSLAWRVRLRKLVGEIWFNDGWKEFAEHYSITYGSFLVFEYRGSSKFNVIIFDRSSVEIGYPCGRLQGVSSPQPNQLSLSKVSGSSKSKTNSESGGSESLLQRVAETEISIDEGIHAGGNACLSQCEAETEISIHEVFSIGGSESLLQDEADTEISIDKAFYVAFGLASPKSEKAVREAKKFRSENPFFGILLRPCNISLSLLHVPAGFSEKYLDALPEYIKLQISDGRKWLVKVIWKKKGGLDFEKGWHEFAEANKLEDGDACIFELLNDNTGFKVSIFRAVRDSGL